MSSFSDQIDAIEQRREQAGIEVYTLGHFYVSRSGQSISAKEWGRDITMQLFQYLVTARHRHALHKEQIIDRLWEDMDGKSGEQNFKVALHGINKALEPERKNRTAAKYIIRQGVTYQLNQGEIWIDVDALEQYISVANQATSIDRESAIRGYEKAIEIYRGIYLPNRLFLDWSSSERERIQVLVLGAMVILSEILLETQPMESIRLAQNALQIDAAYEDAYRIQMQAYFNRGNRPMAIKTYKRCVAVLEEEFGIKPLPLTTQLMEQIKRS